MRPNQYSSEKRRKELEKKKKKEEKLQRRAELKNAQGDQLETGEQDGDKAAEGEAGDENAPAQG